MIANLLSPAAQVDGPDAGFTLDVVHDNKQGGLTIRANTPAPARTSIYLSDGLNRVHLTLPATELVRLWEQLQPIVVDYIKDDCKHNNPQKRIHSDNTNI